MSDVQPLYSGLIDYAGRTVTWAEMGVKITKGLGVGVRGRLMDAMEDTAIEVRNEIVLSMRSSPATGKLYRAGGRLKSGKPRMHRASQPGFPPRPNTGDLIGSIVMDARLTEVEVGSIITQPPYPKWLEEGTQNMDARPWLWPAQTKAWPKLKVSLRRIMNSAAQEIKE